MAFDLGSLLNYNSTTLFLASLVILLYTLRAYLQPIPLAHPLLLGRQSDIGKVRSKGETATYRNYGVGHGVPVRRYSYLGPTSLSSAHFSYSYQVVCGRTS
jgi:hypothetical protein